MEPNKFEEHIRTKLQERELQPSEDSWAALEAQLGEEKKSNRTLWYAIAASLVAILVVGSFLLKDTSTPSQDIVFETPKNDTSIDEKTLENKGVIPEEKLENTSVAEEKVIISEEKTTQPPLQKKQQQIAVAEEKRKKTVSENKKTPRPINNTDVAKIDKVTLEKQSIVKKESKNFVNLKVNEVVAQVQQMNKKNAVVSAQEIEDLLEKAQREITTQRILNEATTKIDPASLLNDVETELERSFRNKVFDALGEGFNTVRTAVVERNN